MSKKDEYVKWKNYKRISHRFITYGGFQSMLVPEDNGNENPKSLIKTSIKNVLLAFIWL